jgi:hypothetical protein
MKRTLGYVGTLLIIVNLGGYLSSLEPPQTAPVENLLESFEVAADGDGLLLPVSVGGEEHLFVLDTGADATVGDISLKGKLENAGDGGMSLGKLRLGSLPSDRTMDLSNLRMVSGHEIMGILGMDKLSRFAVQIDVDAGSVKFLKMPGSDPGVPLQLLGEPHNAPCVRARIGESGNIWGLFILDTGMVGYGTGALKAEFFESLMHGGSLCPLKMSLDLSAAGTSTQRNGRVESLSVGQFNHRDLVFARQRDNLLGLNYLARYVVTFDFPNRIVYLKKGNRFNNVDLQDKSGIHVVRTGNRPVVDSVDPGSPTALAGVLPGDEILRLDDLDAGQLTLFSIRTMLCRPGLSIRLTLRRSASEVALPLALSN